MSKRQTSQLLTAPAGTGKSYMVTHDLVTRFLPNETGKVFTNMPYGRVPDTHSFPPEYDGELFSDRIGEFVARRVGGDASDFSNRICLIPDEVLDSWKSEPNRRLGVAVDGPWNYFDQVDLTGAIIIIDEAHNYCGSNSSPAKKREWQRFCGELRHRGAAIQFVTQSPSKLAKEVINECGLRQALVDSEEERDPIFGIKLFYWYELRAKLFGKYRSAFVRIDLRDIDGRKSKRSNVVRVKREQEIFRLYDSYAAPQAGGLAAGKIEKREWEKRSWPSLLWWFAKRNLGQFFKPVAFGVFVVCAVAFGGRFFEFMTSYVARAASGTATAPSVQRPVNQVERVSVPNTAVVVSTEVVGASSRPAAPVLPDPPFELRVLTPDSATFVDGSVLSVGDIIPEGEFKDEILDSIDWSSRSIVLSSGTRIRLGRLRYSKVRQATEASTTLQARAESSAGQSRR